MKKSTLNYIAGAIEHRGTITENPLSVSLRTTGNLPRQLQRSFGGTCFIHKKKNNKKWKNEKPRIWFRVKYKKAENLLRAIYPFLRMDKIRVRAILVKLDQKTGHPKSRPAHPRRLR